jgi:hypothetical protein
MKVLEKEEQKDGLHLSHAPRRASTRICGKTRLVDKLDSKKIYHQVCSQFAAPEMLERMEL